jgi:hypothetical protein
MSLAKPHPAPARWEEQYRLIEQMRMGIVAPVDDMYVLLFDHTCNVHVQSSSQIAGDVSDLERQRMPIPK